MLIVRECSSGQEVQYLVNFVIQMKLDCIWFCIMHKAQTATGEAVAPVSCTIPVDRTKVAIIVASTA